MEQQPPPGPGHGSPERLPTLLMGQLQRGATQRQYTGSLADADAKALVPRTYNTTRMEADAVDRIVGSPLTLYMAHGDFVRHAVFELLMAYEQDGFPDEFIPDVTAHVRAMREEAQRIRLRQQFADVLLVYETSMASALEAGDYDLVTATLVTLEGYIDRTPEEHWRMYLRRAMLRSGVIRAGVDALYEVARSQPRFQGTAGKWLIWLEGLAE